MLNVIIYFVAFLFFIYLFGLAERFYKYIIKALNKIFYD